MNLGSSYQKRNLSAHCLRGSTAISIPKLYRSNFARKSRCLAPQRPIFRPKFLVTLSIPPRTQSIWVTLGDHYFIVVTKSKPSRLNLARSNRIPWTTHEGMAVYGAVYLEGIASWTLGAGRYRTFAYSPIGELREVGVSGSAYGGSNRRRGKENRKDQAGRTQSRRLATLAVLEAALRVHRARRSFHHNQ